MGDYALNTEARLRHDRSMDGSRIKKVLLVILLAALFVSLLLMRLFHPPGGAQ
jgi:hypothetical protein